MELTAIIIITILAFPYLGLAYFYGLLRLKKIVDKELNRTKGLQAVYESLTPEQRMKADIKRTEKDYMSADKPKSEWLPSPTREQLERRETELKEGLKQPPPGGWQEEKPEVPPPISRLP